MKTVLAALLLSAAAAQGCAGVAIALRAQARVTGPTVTLGDVAILTSTELEPLRRLVDLPLGVAPAAGEIIVLERDALAGWIKAKAGNQAELTWTGPVSSRIVAATRRVAGEEIAATAEAALRDSLMARARSGDLQLRSLPRDLEVPDGKLVLRARALDGASLHTRMTVWVDVWVDQRFVRTVAVPFEVVATTHLPTTTRAARRIAESAPAVQRGQWAFLRSGAGDITLEARVEVLQDGRLGDSVRVRQPGAAGGVIARVTAPGQLELAR